MSANYYRLPGGGSESRPLYPMSWWEGGVQYYFDGSDEHPLGRAAPRDNNAFTIHVSADTPDCECAALAKKFNCDVVRDAK